MMLALTHHMIRPTTNVSMRARVSQVDMVVSIKNRQESAPRKITIDHIRLALYQVGH
jgi:hypothetical protein